MRVELRHVAADESFAQLGMDGCGDVCVFGGTGRLMAYGADGRVVLLHQRPEVGQDGFEESPLPGEVAQAEIHPSHFRLFFAWRASRKIGFGFAFLCKAMSRKGAKIKENLS